MRTPGGRVRAGGSLRIAVTAMSFNNASSTEWSIRPGTAAKCTPGRRSQSILTFLKMSMLHVFVEKE
jgi:hypothetical protein